MGVSGATVVFPQTQITHAQRLSPDALNHFLKPPLVGLRRSQRKAEFTSLPRKRNNCQVKCYFFKQDIR